MAAKIAKRAHKLNMVDADQIRASIHIAKPNIISPKSCFITSIHAPVLGKNLPAEVPMIKIGIPMPKPSANKAVPPKTISPVFPI